VNPLIVLLIGIKDLSNSTSALRGGISVGYKQAGIKRSAVGAASFVIEVL
jgi:hypothetical protein